MLSNTQDVCKNAGFILRITVQLVKIIHILIPIILIALITFDLIKVVTSNADDKVKKDAFSKALKRLIYSIIIFLIPTILVFIFTRVDRLVKNDSNTTITSTSWINCWLRTYYNTEDNDSRYGGTTYEVKATSSPKPTTKPTQSDDIDNTLDPMAIGCCYWSDYGRKWIFNENKDWCESSSYRIGYTRRACTSFNSSSASYTPSPEEYKNYKENKRDTNIACYTQIGIGRLTPFDEYKDDTNRLFVCTNDKTVMIKCKLETKGIDGVLDFEIDNTGIAKWNPSSATTNVAITSSDDFKEVNILPNSNGTYGKTKITVTFKPNDSTNYKVDQKTIPVEVGFDYKYCDD